VGFLALFLHSLIEGLTLRAALAAPGPHVDLELALIAHHLPLTAAVTLPLLELLGGRAALVRLFAIAGAGAGGALAGGLVPGLAEGANSVAVAHATAAMAGALLHVVWDELRRERAQARAAALSRLAAKRPSADSG
jgi:zinc transporter ZupT